VTAAAAPIIALSDVHKVFAGQAAVEGLSLAIAAGEIVALLGQTGAGKSTVMNLILGQYAPTLGKVVVDGCDPFREPASLRGKVAVSFQTDRLLPWRTARRNVEVGLEILKCPKAERPKRAAEWLARVKLFDLHHEKFPHQLSGGMRQRVSLARALVIDPAVVLLDESFSQLDHVTSKALRTDFRELVKQLGKTCLLITHRIDDALEMADRVILLAAPARIVLETPVSDAERGDPNWLAAQARAMAEEMARVQKMPSGDVPVD
jgi:NitT/TauT family transport system ATP-binding protein